MAKDGTPLFVEDAFLDRMPVTQKYAERKLFRKLKLWKELKTYVMTPHYN